VAEEENRNPSKQQALEKILDAGLKLLSAEDLKHTRRARILGHLPSTCKAGR